MYFAVVEVWGAYLKNQIHRATLWLPYVAVSHQMSSLSITGLHRPGPRHSF